MFKTTSDNLQHAARAAALNGTKADLRREFERSDLDMLSERSALVGKKKELESRLARIKHDAKYATVNHPAKRKWETDRAAITGELADVDKQLSAIKVKRQKAISNFDQSPLAFVEAFYRVAQVTLPDEVMTRIRRATVAMLAHGDRGLEAPLDDARHPPL